jgi:predicted deacylase
VEGYVEHYNNVRLNSAVGYITPKDILAGRQAEIHAERDRKLEAARRQRQIRRGYKTFCVSVVLRQNRRTDEQPKADQRKAESDERRVTEYALG